MKRREFIAALGGAAAWPLAARAQQAMPVIGYLSLQLPGDISGTLAAFRQGLSEIGYIEGRNVAIEFRYAERQLDRVPSLVSGLVDRHVAVIVASGVGALAAKAATSNIPIVFVTADDPIKQGLVTSLGRRDGNATGVNLMLNELAGKRFDLLRELVPKAKTVGIIVNPDSPEGAGEAEDMQTLGRALGLQPIVLQVRNERDVEAAFTTLVEQRAGAFIVVPDPVILQWRNPFAALAIQHRLPAIYPLRNFALAGGLMSYGPNLTDAYRTAGGYAGRILKGEKPGDLPVLQPTKFDFVINLKTADAIGLKITPQLLAIADEVIE